jgi:hypothetical protein
LLCLLVREKYWIWVFLFGPSAPIYFSKLLNILSPTLHSAQMLLLPLVGGTRIFRHHIIWKEYCENLRYVHPGPKKRSKETV